MTDDYGIYIAGVGDLPTIIDQKGILQVWADTVIENIGPGNPIKINIYLPESIDYVRKAYLSLFFDDFRAYDKTMDNVGAILTTEEPVASHNHNLAVTINNPKWGVLMTKAWYSGETLDYHEHPYIWGMRGIASGGAEQQHSHTETSSHAQNSVESHHHATQPHKHPAEQGIYTGGKPAGVTVKVNFTAVGDTYNDTVTDILLAPVLFSTGGAWNTIEISSTALGRIGATYFMQAFCKQED